MSDLYLLPLGILQSAAAAKPLIEANRAWSLGDGRGFTAAAVWRRGGARRIITPNGKPADTEFKRDEAATAKLLAALATPRGGGNIEVMGIINVTPDSFSDGGDNMEPKRAIAHGKKMVTEGATILDIGGESTRPGAAAVAEDEELRRVLPIIEGLADCGVKISIDSQKAEVMRRATALGATIINDVSALAGEGCLEVAAATAAEVVLMHKRGSPQTMQDDTDYADLLAEVYDYLGRRVRACERAGIPKGRIMVDVGIGFAKTAAANLQLLRALPMFYGLGCRLLLGVSRKRFISALSKDGEPKQRLGGSLAAVLAANLGGGDIVRSHDVAVTRQALDVYSGILG